MSDIRLLILDDEPATGQTIEMIARSSGLASRFTSRPDEFFELVASWNPSHIALDLLMPDMDGVEVLGRLSAINCQAKIIITSGVGQRVLEAAGRSALDHGLAILGVLPKPFSPSALRSLLLGRTAADASVPPVARHAADTLPVASPRTALSVAEFEAALHGKQFEVVYQPQVQCASGAVTGFEVLARWRHPDAGIIMPDHFIRFAEQHGLIGALTDVVLDQALGWFASAFKAPNGALLAALGGTAPASLTLAVNLSVRTLRDPGCIDSYLARCQQHGVSPTQVRFELTESSAMEDPLASGDLLTRLRLKGFQLSIDDFGTAYSSMLQLVKLPFTEMKIDRYFVGRALREQESRSVAKAIIELGHSLGLLVTAEGIEDRETLDYLRELGCDQAQGYYLGRPMAGSAVGAWLDACAVSDVQARSAGR